MPATGLYASRAFSHLILTQRYKVGPVSFITGEEKEAHGEEFSEIVQLDGDGANIQSKSVWLSSPSIFRHNTEGFKVRGLMRVLFTSSLEASPNLENKSLDKKLLLSPQIPAIPQRFLPSVDRTRHIYKKKKRRGKHFTNKERDIQINSKASSGQRGK